MSLRLFALAVLAIVVSTTAAAQGSSAFVEQVGSGHAAEVLQTASEAFVFQTAGASAARIEQVGGGEHVARLDQSDGSLATVFQSGTGNTLAGIGALGAGDLFLPAIQIAGELLLTQTGMGNAAFVQQAGGFASITQTGSNNTATVVQSGGTVILP